MSSSSASRRPSTSDPAFTLDVETGDCNLVVRERVELLPDTDPRRVLLRALRPDLIRAMCLPRNGLETRVRDIVVGIMAGKITHMRGVVGRVPEDFHRLSPELIAEAESMSRATRTTRLDALAVHSRAVG